MIINSIKAGDYKPVKINIITLVSIIEIIMALISIKFLYNDRKAINNILLPWLFLVVISSFNFILGIISLYKRYVYRLRMYCFELFLRVMLYIFIIICFILLQINFIDWDNYKNLYVSSFRMLYITITSKFIILIIILIFILIKIMIKSL